MTVAHQLHYTSAATGLAGRPGFQFVAASPGATAAVQQAVSPYLTYRPPPSAPSQPTRAELASFPVSYCFVPEGSTAILAQCRYLGTDYSGRYGNFLGHAVVAELAELGERPPIALWRSPIWASDPAPATDPPLPELTELPPGEVADRDAVAGWLADADHALLAQLLAAVLATLDGRAGQVVLVADQVETVARWIAAVSLSLPLVWARRLSFVTYTGDATRARQHLVGTTTDAWRGAAGHGQVFRLDERTAQVEGRGAPGWYAAGLAEAWRTGDHYQLDVLNELASTVAGAADRDAVAALARLCRGDPLDPDAAAAVAGLLTGQPDRLPGWVWDDLASRVTVDLGVDLALALHQTARHTGRGALADHAGAIAVELAIGRPADRPGLAAVKLSTGAAAGLAGPVEAALRAPADLDDLVAIVREAQRLHIAVSPDGLYEGTARAVRAMPPAPAPAAPDPAPGAAPRRGIRKRSAGGAPPPGTGGIEELLRAVTEPVPRAAVLKGLVEGLAHGGDDLLGRLLTDEVCDLLGRRDWAAAPRAGAHVLASRGRRYPTEREPVTAALADLADRGLLHDHELGRRLREIWHAGNPSPELCVRLLHGVTGPQQARHRGVVALARRAFATGDLGSPEALGLADGLHRLLGRDPREPAVADATAVRAIHRARTDGAPALLELSGVAEIAEPVVYQQAVATVAATSSASFATAPVALQADVLLRLPPGSELRRRLVQVLLDRVDAGHRGAGLNLANLAILLWRHQRPDPALIGKVVKLARHPQHGRNMRAGLQRRYAPLVGELEDMIEDHNDSLWSRIMRRRQG